MQNIVLQQEINMILYSILQTGVLRIRMMAISNDLHGVVSEADHIHNIPEYLIRPNLDLLDFYLSTERVAYTTSPNSDAEIYESQWVRLNWLVCQLRSV